MAKIDELLQELCPDGVEFYPLWRVTAWDKKFNGVDKSMQEKIVKYKYLLAKDLENIIDVNGNVRILYTTTDVAFTTEEKAGEFISEGEIVAIPWGGNVSVKYYKGKFVTGDNRIATSLDTSVLDNKYLFFWMENNIDLLSSFYRGAGIKHPSMLSVLNLEIPIPHINIQHYIVETLDTFTDAISNLEEELALREKQFEYYREQLLSFDDETSLAIKLFSDRVENVKVGEACEVITDYVAAGSFAALRNKVTYLKDDGYAQLVRTSDLKQNFSNSKDFVYVSKDAFEFLWRVNLNTECIILPNVGINCGEVYYISPNLLNHQYNVLGPNAIKVESNKHNNRFLFFLFQTKKVQNEIKKITSSGGQPKFNKTKLKDIIISLPSLNEQHEIVEILDTFDAMIANIKEEIALRTKQYEYYREKLLSFGK